MNSVGQNIYMPFPADYFLYSLESFRYVFYVAVVYFFREFVTEQANASVKRMIASDIPMLRRTKSAGLAVIRLNIPTDIFIQPTVHIGAVSVRTTAKLILKQGKSPCLKEKRIKFFNLFTGG